MNDHYEQFLTGDWVHVLGRGYGRIIDYDIENCLFIVEFEGEHGYRRGYIPYEELEHVRQRR